MCRYALLGLTGGLIGFVCALMLPGMASGAVAHHKRIVLTPRDGQREPARPLRIRVHAGPNARVTARLNHQKIESRLFKGGSKRRVRVVQATPSHGLKHGRNLLRVKVRRHGGRRAHQQVVRFHVARNRPLAAVGVDTKTIAGTPTYLSGLESRGQPQARGAAAASSDEGLSYGWDVKSTPPAADLPLAPLDVPTWVPTFTDPGKYVLSLTVTENGVASAPADVTIRVIAPPLVSVDTQIQGAGGPDDWGIQVGDAKYLAREQYNPWLQVVVLDRSTLAPLANKTFRCVGPQQPCVDQVKEAFSGANALNDGDLVLAANHPGPGWSPPELIPQALKAIGVGVSDHTWPWYVVPASGGATGGYSSIGVPGEPAGTAAEAWARTPSTTLCDANCADVHGYLVQDYGDTYRYNWMSADRVPFDTRADGSSDTRNVIQVDSHYFTQSLKAGQTGGFQVAVVDRYDLSPVDAYWFPTAGPGVDETTYESSLDGMAAALRSAASTPITSALPGADGKQLCVDLRGGNNTPGTVVQSFTCNGTPAQSVVAIPGVSPGDGAAGVELQAKGMCIQVSGTNDQAPVTIDTCNGQEWQQWHFDDQGRLVGFGGRCLAIGGAAADHDKSGQALVVAGCQPYLSQKWRTDSSQMAFVAPVGSPQVRLTDGSPSEKTSYDRGVKMDAVGDAIAALGGTANAFNSLPAGSKPQLYGLVGWAGAVPARAPQESGPTDQMPTARIAGTLSTDKWQRYEVQDTEPGATRVAATPQGSRGDHLSPDDTQPMDVIWRNPDSLWPEQDPEVFPDPAERERKQAAVAWISRQPSINRAGDVRAAFIKEVWDPQTAGQMDSDWKDTSDDISKLSYSDCTQRYGRVCRQEFTRSDFEWAQSELMSEIRQMRTAHLYLQQLLMAKSSTGAVFNFNNKVDALVTKLQTDKVVPGSVTDDKTLVWGRLVVNTAVELLGAIPYIGPFARENFEIARSIIEGVTTISNSILDGNEIAKENETQEPGPPSDELAGAVTDVKGKIADQYTGAQDANDLYARIVASDPTKLADLASLRLGCRDNDDCPAVWRLSPADQKVAANMLSYSTERMVWSMLVPAAYKAWQIRIGAYGPNARPDTVPAMKPYDTVVTGFKDASKLYCLYKTNQIEPQVLTPFANAGPNGMAAFRKGYGYEGSGQWEGPSSSLKYGSNGLLYELWVLGERDPAHLDNYTVPGSDVFDRLFAPVDSGLDPSKGGLGVNKEDWYAQTFPAVQWKPYDSKWYTSFPGKGTHPFCLFNGG
jgi:ricin-type beta-trefoil lectin protein